MGEADVGRVALGAAGVGHDPVEPGDAAGAGDRAARCQVGDVVGRGQHGRLADRRLGVAEQQDDVLVVVVLVRRHPAQVDADDVGVGDQHVAWPVRRVDAHVVQVVRHRLVDVGRGVRGVQPVVGEVDVGAAAAEQAEVAGRGERRDAGCGGRQQLLVLVVRRGRRVGRELPQRLAGAVAHRLRGHGRALGVPAGCLVRVGVRAAVVGDRGQAHRLRRRRPRSSTATGSRRCSAGSAAARCSDGRCTWCRPRRCNPAPAAAGRAPARCCHPRSRS